jgi:hypothetical protein
MRRSQLPIIAAAPFRDHQRLVRFTGPLELKQGKSQRLHPGGSVAPTRERRCGSFLRQPPPRYRAQRSNPSCFSTRAFRTRGLDVRCDAVIAWERWQCAWCLSRAARLLWRVHLCGSRDSLRLRAEKNRIGLDKHERFHHAVCADLVFLEVRRLQMRLIGGSICIQLEDPDLGWIALHGDRI